MPPIRAAPSNPNAEELKRSCANGNRGKLKLVADLNRPSTQVPSSPLRTGWSSDSSSALFRHGAASASWSSSAISSFTVSRPPSAAPLACSWRIVSFSSFAVSSAATHTPSPPPRPLTRSARTAPTSRPPHALRTEHSLCESRTGPTCEGLLARDGVDGTEESGNSDTSVFPDKNSNIWIFAKEFKKKKIIQNQCDFNRLTGLTGSPGSESTSLSCLYMDRMSTRSTALERFRDDSYASRMSS
ncbi:hypothetical protein EYF80_048851 [Liparis tanakae]|uniref:Uncharacterized protein n=1 Tax=Liparis tanakae TaxID=230148 RepID=A0A4Z2FIE4_9TELE|nr:hypothetical protein EYF80_048851 [Liparis tanakae]